MVCLRACEASGWERKLFLFFFLPREKDGIARMELETCTEGVGGAARSVRVMVADHACGWAGQSDPRGGGSRLVPVWRIVVARVAIEQTAAAAGKWSTSERRGKELANRSRQLG
jgi:hypothetical protein